jgi:hypothetical protein
MDCYTPSQKIEAVGEVTSLIKNEIKQFWEGVNVDQKKLTLDGD